MPAPLVSAAGAAGGPRRRRKTFGRFDVFSSDFALIRATERVSGGALGRSLVAHKDCRCCGEHKVNVKICLRATLENVPFELPLATVLRHITHTLTRLSHPESKIQSTGYSPGVGHHTSVLTADSKHSHYTFFLHFFLAEVKPL